MFLPHGTYRVKITALASEARDVNALRHVTYQPREPWIPEDDLVLQKTLGDRVKYVRTNLVDEDGNVMTQPMFAKAVGLAEGQHGVIAWERRGTEPRSQARERIAALTQGEYRAAVFSRRGAEEILVESAAPRLRSLEDEADRTRQMFGALLDHLELELVPGDGQADPTTQPIQLRRVQSGKAGRRR